MYNRIIQHRMETNDECVHYNDYDHTMYDLVKTETQTTKEGSEENTEFESLNCYECNVSFTTHDYLLRHLLHHVKQPSVTIKRLQLAPIKLTFKSKSDNNFEIVHSPTTTTAYQSNTDFLANGQAETNDGNDENSFSLTEFTSNLDEFVDDIAGLDNVTNFSPLSSDKEGVVNINNELPKENTAMTPDTFGTEVSVPGAEPTPPPESPSPTEYPKIRIKTTGLLKEPLTITEITEDNPNGDFRPSELVDISNSNENNTDTSNFWSSSCMEDPLKLPDVNREDSILSSFLNNNNDHNKDFGMSSSDNEFISLDRLDDRNRNSLQVYNPRTSAVATNSLNTLTGLPMQQLAEQVSRLQPSGNGMHQQNVLINIQQFPQAPPQPPHGYQHSPMYPPHPGMPAQPPHMYQPYQYQPPNPMYYPPAPNYPPGPHMAPPQMQQPPQQMSQQAMPPPQQPPPYRQPMPPRPVGPRPFNQQPPRGPPPPRQIVPRPPQVPNRQPVPPRQPLGQRPQMMPRQRHPLVRPKNNMIGTAVRGPGPRPRMQNPNVSTNVNNLQAIQRLKRANEQLQNQQMKKKRLDVLMPDKNDDQDCQVIAVQPKNTDGGLPQIQSVQGGTSDPSDNNVMHLSDSITLSVRNPPPRTESPKKSDAKVVANILATRGITVTATPKAKERQSSSKEESSSSSVAINLNSAVSIIPSKNGGPAPKASSDSRLPTVDLTDDSTPESAQSKAGTAPGQKNNARSVALPFKCDLCPAQYPTTGGLTKHRQTYHKTTTPCELGVPIIDFKQPGIAQRLTSLGIYNFIPLPNSSPNGTFALPIVSLNAAKNSSICNLGALGASSILSLGPVRSLPKNQTNNAPGNKQ